MGPAQGRRAGGAPGPLPLCLKPRGEQGAQRPPHGPDTPGVPFRRSGGHSRDPRKGAGAAGLGACEQSPHAAQHGEKKARPPHCIRGHGTLAGQNAGHTGQPPTLALPRALLPFPRNASISSTPGGGFSLLLIANDFSNSLPPHNTPRFLPSCTPLPEPPGRGDFPRGLSVSPAPLPAPAELRRGTRRRGDRQEEATRWPEKRGAAGGEGPGCCPRPLCLPPAPRGRGVRTSSIQVATILLMKGWMSFWTHLK